MDDLSVLNEANVGGLLTEALTADVEAVLADETGLVGADTAATGALAVLPRARVPDGFVRHDCGLADDELLSRTRSFRLWCAG